MLVQENLNKVLVFNKLEPALQRKVVSEMYERAVSAGEILIKEGDSGAAASELYVVKSGKFEVSSGGMTPLCAEHAFGAAASKSWQVQLLGVGSHAVQDMRVAPAWGEAA